MSGMATKRKGEALPSEPEGAPTIEGVEFLSREESRALFDRVARRKVGLSGPEFVRRWEAGAYDADPEAVMELVILLPFAR